MKIIDRSTLRNETGEIELRDRLKGILQFGIAWDQEFQAQARLVFQLRRILNNQYSLLRDVTVPGLSAPIPFVLVGPSGIRVVFASPLKGIYRAQNEIWAVMDNRKRRFRSVRPNLPLKVVHMGQAVEAFLNRVNHPVEPIEPILYFSNPGIHVDTIRPAARIVLSDGVEHFATSLIQSQKILEPLEVERIVDLLAEAKPDAPPEVDELPSRPSRSEPRRIGIGKLRMLIWQWLLLVGMILVEVLVVVAFVYLILSNP